MPSNIFSYYTYGSYTIKSINQCAPNKIPIILYNITRKNLTLQLKEIGIRASNIQTFEGAEIIVPNGEMISNKVTNWTLSNKRMRPENVTGVAFKLDPHQVHDLLLSILDNHPEILKLPEPGIFLTSMGNNSLDFKINFWIADFIDGKRIRSEVLFKIFDVLKENGIEIPFPQRDLHLRSVDQDITIQASNSKKKN